MARKGTALLGAVSVGLIALFASGDNCYYRTNGSGTWEDASRWDGGKVPQSGDVVCITNGTARATAADISVLTRIYAITLLRTNDVIEFDLDVDYHHPTRIIGKGKVVKNGTGALYLDEKFSKLYLTTGGIEVNGGELHLVEVDTTDKNAFTYGPLTVNAPGKLFLRPGGASYTPGISGDGVITNTSTGAKELCIITNDTIAAGTAYAFSGILSPNVSPTFSGAERQDMLVDNPYALTVRAASGTIGVKKFGNAGEPGSLGTANNIWLNSSSALEPPHFLYLGEEGETTTKSFRMNTSPRAAIFDGGARGGLKLTGDFYLTRNLSTMTQLILDGSNTTVCTFASKALESTADTALAAHIVKRGTGTWRLNAVNGSELRGGITIEKGTLEAQTIVAAGSACSIGKATVRQSAYWGAKDASKDVPWAILLGDGTVPEDLADVGTLSYVGISAVDCSTRLVALNGAGRLLNASSVAFTWSGVTSSCEGDHTLVLAGEGTADSALNVTNGPGRITVVKEGSGTWTLDHDIDVSAFDVRGGTLDVKVAVGDGETYVKPTSIDFISASSGGTLKVDVPINANGICCDVATGNGTVQGFTFPPAGELRVKGAGQETTVLPISFVDCTDVGNIANWTLYVDGRRKTSRRICVTAGGGIYITGNGICVTFR
jgi:autotransporter-associated beta strand protein